MITSSLLSLVAARALPAAPAVVRAPSAAEPPAHPFSEMLQEAHRPGTKPSAQPVPRRDPLQNTSQGAANPPAASPRQLPAERPSEPRPASHAARPVADKGPDARDAGSGPDGKERIDDKPDKTDSPDSLDASGSEESSRADRVNALTPGDSGSGSGPAAAAHLATVPALAGLATDTPGTARPVPYATDGQGTEILDGRIGVSARGTNQAAATRAESGRDDGTSIVERAEFRASRSATAAPADGLGQPETAAASAALLRSTGAGRPSGSVDTPGSTRPAKLANAEDSSGQHDAGSLASASDGRAQLTSSTQTSAQAAIAANGDAVAQMADLAAAVSRERLAQGGGSDGGLVDIRGAGDAIADVGAGVGAGVGSGVASPGSAGAASPDVAGAAHLAGATGATPAPGRASATTASHPLDASPDSVGFGAEVGTRITTFALNGVQHARLELNPAEMGPVTVQIQLDGQAAQVHLAADHAGTRRALEQSMPQLAAALRDAGLTLSGGGVFEQPRPPQQGRDDNAPRQDSRGSAVASISGLAASTGAAPVGVRKRGVVDLVA